MWAAGIKSLYLTSDGGAQWRTVTPPNLANQYVAERVDHHWRRSGRTTCGWSSTTCPGSSPTASPRTDPTGARASTARPTEDKTWTFSTLPGCLQLCGPTALSFVDADHGFAATSADQGNPDAPPAMFFATQDGGATWQQSATPPDLGGVVMGGPAPDPQLVFTSAQDGWAVSGPLEGPDATTSNPGGVVYRTTDGGTTWSVAPGLPSGDMSLPPSSARTTGSCCATRTAVDVQPVVYVTQDGGGTWSPVALPAAAVEYYKGGAPLAGRFSAVSPTHWFVVNETKLYATTDGGRHWTVEVPTPAFQASSDVFTSSRDGLAVGQFAHCTFAATAAHPNPPSCYPLLVLTSDGGRHWRTPASDWDASGEASGLPIASTRWCSAENLDNSP